MSNAKSNDKKLAKLPKILVASGVNLDLLGRREPDIYGHATLADMETLVQTKFASRAQIHFVQTNVESEYLSLLDGGWAGAVLNPGAWTHTSLALADRLTGLQLPFVEVHLSNTAAREAFRHHSYTARLAVGVVQGFGIDSYLLGVDGLLTYLAKRTR